MLLVAPNVMQFSPGPLALNLKPCAQNLKPQNSLKLVCTVESAEPLCNAVE